MDENKKTIAVLFGGQSPEHEISIITGLQILHNLDSEKYNALPVYFDQEGQWWTGQALLKRNFFKKPDFDQLKRLSFLPEPNGGLIEYPNKKLGLPKKIPVDVYFPAFHGTLGEDGSVQGLLEMAKAAYAGPGVLAASISMNKVLTKRLARDLGIPVLPYKVVSRQTWDPQKPQPIIDKIVKSQLSFPLFVKPVHLGSSVGISSAKNEKELSLALAGAFVFDDKVMVEPMIEDLVEVNCSILQGRPPKFSVTEKPKTDSGLLSFEEKYMKGEKGTKLISQTEGGSQGMADMRREIDPQEVSEETKKRIQKMSQLLFAAIEGRGVARIDFMIDRSTGDFYLTEINTIPGSLSYYLWEGSDPQLTFPELLNELINLALKNLQSKNKSQRQLKKKIFDN